MEQHKEKVRDIRRDYSPGIEERKAGAGQEALMGAANV